MPSPSSPDSESEKKPAKTLAQFFMDCPPQTLWELDPRGSLEPINYQHGSYKIIFPVIELFCAGDCDGVMNFAPSDSYITLRKEKPLELFVEYRCRNCDTESKRFAVLFLFGQESDTLEAIKYGEFPAFGPPLPARLQRLFQGDVQLLKKGFRAEKWGYGVAAFTYYRQVVESQRDRLFDRILGAARAVNAPQTEIDRLEKAKTIKQFSTSLKEAKEEFPQSLMVSGQNPMALLHQVCSEVIHNLTDEQCLDLATSTRKLLIAFSERLDEAIKNQKDLEESLKLLMQRRKE